MYQTLDKIYVSTVYRHKSKKGCRRTRIMVVSEEIAPMKVAITDGGCMVETL